MSKDIEVRVELVIESLDRSKILIWEKPSNPGVVSFPYVNIIRTKSAVQYALSLMKGYLKSSSASARDLEFVGVTETNEGGHYTSTLVFRVDFESLHINDTGSNSLCEYALVNIWDLPSDNLDDVAKSTLTLLHISDRTRFLPFFMEELK